MINRTEIETCFTSLVGWRESAQAPACFSNLSAELIQSDSGIYVNDLSGMNLQLINEVLGKDETNVNTFLQDIQNSCAIELINDFTVLQRERLNSKALLSNFNVGTKLADIRNKETKRSRFVGFQIKPHESNSIKVSLSQIGVQFDTAETINIYFYSSTSLAPVKIQSITNTKLSSVEWFTLTDFVAEYISETQGSGAEYYIGYYEEDLTGQAIETSLACGTCGNAPKKIWSKYLDLYPIEVESGHTYASKELFDVESVGMTTSTYGLHLKVNAQCDVTEAICANKLLFSNALQKKIAIRLFWEAFNSDRINRTTFINKADAQMMAEKYELDLEDEMKVLTIDFSMVDQICMPCKKRTLRGVNLY